MTRRLGGVGWGTSILAAVPIVTVLSCGLLAGCGGDDNNSGPTTDGGVDGSADADAGLDAHSDASDGGAKDGAPDSAPSDGSTDSGMDSSEDVGVPPDTGTTDTGTTDTGTTDTGATGVGDATTDAPSDSGTGEKTDAADATTDATTPTDATTDATSTDATADASPDASADAGGPSASFITTPINLGPGNCGGAATTASSLLVANHGTAPLTVNASLGSGTAFSLGSFAQTTVSPGDSTSIPITATVPSTATAGVALTATLTVTTNDSAHASTPISVSVLPQGVTLAWATGSPTDADFGIAPNNTPDTPIPLVLQNVGNVAAPAVTFSSPTDTQFGLTPFSASAVAATTGTIDLTATFTPDTLTASQATSTVTVAAGTPVCGASVTSIAFSGQGGTSVVTGWPAATVDFLGSPCGGAAPAGQSFTLTNSGTLPAGIASVVATGYPGYATDLSATSVVPANGSLVVQLAAPAVPPTSAVPGNYAAQLTVTTTIPGDSPHTINLTNEAVGAILAFDTSPTPSFGLFGPVPAVSTSASEAFNVVNSGNASANVTLTTAAPFGATPGTFQLLGSPTTPVVQPDTASFSPTTYGFFSGTIAISTTGTTLCQPLPAPLPLSGTGELGGVSFSATAFQFQADCGTAAPTQTLTITNNGNEPVNLESIALTAGTNYSLTNATLPILLAASGGATSVTIVPGTIPVPTLASITDQITVTTDIAGDVPHVIGLTETPIGDVITLVPAPPGPFDLGPTPVTTTSQAQTFEIVNSASSATAPANLTISSTNLDFGVTPSISVPSAGGSVNVPLTFAAPATAGLQTSNLTITTTDPLCAALPGAAPSTLRPGTYPVEATATEAGPSIQPGSLNFGLNNCGAPAAGAQNITITNTGNQDFHVTSWTVSNPSYYTLSSSSPLGVDVQANGGNSVVITVTPNAIPATVTAVPAYPTYAGTVFIDTDANVAVPDFTVSLTMGAQGVIVNNNLATTTFAFGTVTVPGRSDQIVTIDNVGNWPLQAELAGLNTGVFFLSPSPTLEATSPGDTNLVTVFAPNVAHTSWADTATLVIAPTAGGVFCSPLPESWDQTITLTGSSR